MILEGLHVARPDPHQRAGVDRQLGCRGRGEDDPTRPGQEAAGQLEAGVLLADDEDPPIGIALGRPRVGIVRRVPVQRHPKLMAIPVRSANVARLRSISGRDGKYDDPSISSGISPRASGSSARRLFQS